MKLFCLMKDLSNRRIAIESGEVKGTCACGVGGELGPSAKQPELRRSISWFSCLQSSIPEVRLTGIVLKNIADC